MLVKFYLISSNKVKITRFQLKKLKKKFLQQIFPCFTRVPLCLAFIYRKQVIIFIISIRNNIGRNQNNLEPWTKMRKRKEDMSDS